MMSASEGLLKRGEATRSAHGMVTQALAVDTRPMAW
jgi:hypothetical protein